MSAQVTDVNGHVAVADIVRGKAHVLETAILYAITFLVLALVIYYIPDYSFLEAITAEHSAGVLNAMGIPAVSTIVEGSAYVNNVQIVRECTGIQVIAVFVGFVLPLPRVGWAVKLKAVAVLAFAVHVANVLRVATELWLLYAGIMPWSMAHGPLGAVLGVITVFIFFLVSDRFIPQIGVFLGNVADWIVNRVRSIF